jgi:hypothetical protein
MRAQTMEFVDPHMTPGFWQSKTDRLAVASNADARETHHSRFPIKNANKVGAVRKNLRQGL